MLFELVLIEKISIFAIDCTKLKNKEEYE